MSGNLENNNGNENLEQILTTARKVLAVLEVQAAGYTSLTIPAHLKIQLDDKRKEVADYEKKINSLKNFPINNIQQINHDGDLFALILKVQGSQTPLSQCIAEALPIAHRLGDLEFTGFCKYELLGWQVGKVPNYRSIKVYYSPFIATGNGPEMFMEMKLRPTEFFEGNRLITSTLSEVEYAANTDLARTYRWGSEPIIKDGIDLGIKKYWYAEVSSFKKILENIRAELTQRLFSLLQQVA